MSEHTRTIDTLQAISTARSIHRYRFEPIPEKDLAKILWAGTRAPSGTNRQPFRFLVLRDSEQAKRVKAVLGHAFRGGWRAKVGAEGWRKESDEQRTSRRIRAMEAVQEFVDNFERIPVVVLACLVRYREPRLSEGASIYPACQNILLAARALGYGACFSGWHRPVEEELREMLQLPDNVALALTITLGRPRGRHGPLRRFPARELIYEDRWGTEAEWVEDPPGSRFSRSRMTASEPAGPSR